MKVFETCSQSRFCVAVAALCCPGLPCTFFGISTFLRFSIHLVRLCTKGFLTPAQKPSSPGFHHFEIPNVFSARRPFRLLLPSGRCSPSTFSGPRPTARAWVYYPSSQHTRAAQPSFSHSQGAQSSPFIMSRTYISLRSDRRLFFLITLEDSYMYIVRTTAFVAIYQPKKDVYVGNANTVES